MDHSFHSYEPTAYPSPSMSQANLQFIFNSSLGELYFANQAIVNAFTEFKNFISSPQLLGVLKRHYHIHMSQKSRLERIFQLQKRAAESKDCHAVNAILTQAMEYGSLFVSDPVNFEISLILTSRKLAHYKIAAYGAAAHLALSLHQSQAATLLAIGVQEEEEYLERDLNVLTEKVLTPSSKGG